LFSPQSPPANAGAQAPGGVENGIPRELKKTVLPPYVIEPPDLLLIEAYHTIPKQPYQLQPLDRVEILVTGTPTEAPIAGIYFVGGDGNINLGPHYGSVHVAGLTIEGPSGAKAAITKYLSTTLNNPEVAISLSESALRQRISGPHLVAMDGTVTLGSYGSVSVIGMTVAQARMAVQEHLKQFFDTVDISLEVNGYNSKIYYIVTQGAGLGDGVYRFPITGNETVLDAISQINGLQRVSSKRIWVARPTDTAGGTQRLEVNWEDITANANACSNYQILPGDRVFVAEDCLIAVDTAFGKFIAPIERVFGISVFGAGAVTRFSGHVLEGGGNPNGTF